MSVPVKKSTSITVDPHWQAYIASWATLSGLSFSQLTHLAINQYIQAHPLPAALQEALDKAIQPPTKELER